MTYALQYRCLHCGQWYLLKSSADRCRERAIPEVMAHSQAAQDRYSHGERNRRIEVGLPPDAGRGPMVRLVKT